MASETSQFISSRFVKIITPWAATCRASSRSDVLDRPVAKRSRG